VSTSDLIEITSVDALAAWQGPILQLFETTYGRQIAAAEWEWFYLRNPTGPACVCLYIEDGELLGHYSTIPTWLRKGDAPVYAHRSMTTMVHPKAQGRGLFTTLATRAYGRLEQEGVALVYGFPNQNSAGTFGRSLGWTLPPIDIVADLTGRQIQTSADLSFALTDDAGLHWDMENTAQTQWRLARPGAKARYRQGLVVKSYEGRPNLLHLDRDGLAALKLETLYRVLVPQGLRNEIPADSRVFDYQFGYRVFDDPTAPDIFLRELILSDVF
jgi:GNAT superfamily N-acetyltransferase